MPWALVYRAIHHSKWWSNLRGQPFFFPWFSSFLMSDPTSNLRESSLISALSTVGYSPTLNNKPSDTIMLYLMRKAWAKNRKCRGKLSCRLSFFLPSAKYFVLSDFLWCDVEVLIINVTYLTIKSIKTLNGCELFS